MIVFHCPDPDGLVHDIDEFDYILSRMNLTRDDSEKTTAKLDTLRRAVSSYKRYIINPLAWKLGMKMNKPLHEIKDDEQLEFVIEAIDEIDYELSLFQFKLAYLFDDAEDAYDALLHLRMLIQNFMRTVLALSTAQKATMMNNRPRIELSRDLKFLLLNNALNQAMEQLDRDYLQLRQFARNVEALQEEYESSLAYLQSLINDLFTENGYAE